MTGIRVLTEELGILMIMDEVKTGFRVTLGGAQEYYHVKPDLTAMGKVIGAGFPVGILGIEYYDRDIVDSVAKDTKMPVCLISDEEETAKTSFFRMKFPLGRGTSAVQDEIFESQRRIISKLADTQSCIIVGRCSDYVLRNHPRLFRIFIYAPFEARYRNCVENLHMEPAEAQKMIAEVDKARDAYHLGYAKYLPYDITHNELLVDSSVLGVDGTAKYLSEFVLQRLSIS